MNQVQRIVKNIGVTGLGQVITAFMGFILLIYLARFLGEADFGKYNFALSLTTLLATFTDLGVNQLLVREIARERDQSARYVNNAVLLKVPLSVLTMGVTVFISWIMGLEGDIKVIVYLFGAYNILLTISGTYLSLFQAWERMEYVTLFQTVERLFIVGLGLAVLFMGYGVIEVALVYLIAGFIDITFSALLSFRKFIRPSFRIEPGLQRDLLVMGLPFGLNSLFAVFFFKIDSVILGLMKGDVAVGIYNAAYNPLLSLSFIAAGMVSAAIYPVMSRYFRGKSESLHDFTVVSSRYLVIIGLPIAAGCSVLADRFIALFYGGGYAAAVIPFQILAIFIPIRLVSTITGTLLSSIDRQGYRMLAVGLSAVFNIILNIILIPIYSYIGASVATVASEFLLYLLFLFYIGRHYRELKMHGSFIKPVAAALIMAVVVYAIRALNLALIIGMASVIYIAVLILLGTFNEDDMMLFRKLVGMDS